MKLPLVAACVLTIGLVFASKPESWTPDIASIQKLESSIHPSDYPKWRYAKTQPAVADYARYYAGYVKDGHRMIAGELVILDFDRDKRATVHVVASEKDFPVIYDGGCGIVKILYDSDTGRIISLNCNGLA